MKIAFIYGAYENLGIEYISSVLKKNGHKVFLIYHPLLFKDALLNIDFLAPFFEHKNKLINELIKISPDIIAFSCVTDWYKWMSEFAKDIKKIMPDIPIIFGGIHATTASNFLIKQDFIDFLCIGEGEYAMLDLCNALEKGKNFFNIPNIWVKYKNKIYKNTPRPLIKELDKLPFPDKELFYKKVPYFKNVYTIMASRGCPYNCTYCINNSLKTIYKKEPLFRKRNIENVIQELEYGLKKWNFKEVLIEDDIFTGDTERIKKFCELYKKKINKPFVCVTHPQMVKAEELEMLKWAGCIQMEIGIQTLNEYVRKKYLNRYETNNEIIKALKTLHNSKIPFNIDHIVGLPEDTFDYQVKALKLYNEARPNRLLFFFITYYPGTDIFKIEEKIGNIDKNLKEKIFRGEGESDEQYGSIEDDKIRNEMGRLRFLFGYLPLLPKRIVRFLLKKKITKFLPKSIIFNKMIPAIISTLFGKEPRGKVILKKYIYHILRLGF